MSVEGQGEAKWLLGRGAFFSSASCLFLGFGTIEGLADLFVFSQPGGQGGGRGLRESVTLPLNPCKNVHCFVGPQTCRALNSRALNPCTNIPPKMIFRGGGGETQRNKQETTPENGVEEDEGRGEEKSWRCLLVHYTRKPH